MGLLLVAGFSCLFLLHSFYQLKSVKNFSVFALDRNAFGMLALYCSILASGIGAGLLMGGAEKSYASGWFYALGCLGFSAQLLLSAALAGRIYQWRHCLSSGEILGEVYQSGNIRLISGGIWLLFCVGIISAQVVAMQRVAAMLAPDWQWEAALLLALTVIIYSSLGGIRSVVSTDVLQSVLLILAMVAVVIWGVEATGGINNFLEHSQSRFQQLRFESPLLLGLLFMGFFLGDALIPTSIQRVAMARNVRHARQALILTAVLVAFIVMISGALGIIASLLNDQQSPNAVFPILMTAMPGGLGAFLILGLLAAAMSSCDSYLNTAAVAFSNDILPVFKPEVSDRQKLVFGRIATAAIGAGAIIIALRVEDILDILLSTFEAWGPTLLPPFTLALFFKRLPVTYFYLPFVSGLAALLLWKCFFPDTDWTAAGLLVGIFANAGCILLLLIIYRFRRF